jgi:hypothetical protein
MIKYSVLKLLISSIVASALLMSCNNAERKNAKANELADSAKTTFFAAESLNPDETAKKLTLYKKADSLLNLALAEDSTNAGALYFSGYVKDRLAAKALLGINFETANYTNAKTASKYLESLIKAHPDYMPEYKLSPQGKLTSIWGSLAFNYIIKNHADSAKLAFAEGRKHGAFTDGALEYCRNLLSQLDQNGILFIQGDVETFSCWSLQYIEGLRKDITIVNLSLIASPWYIKWLSYPQNIGAPIESPFDEDRIRYYFSPKSSEQTERNISVDINSVSSQIKNEFGNIPSKMPITLKGRASGPNGGAIMTPSDFMLLEIIESSVGSRPIYFTISAAKNETPIVGLNEYLQMQGICARLRLNKVKISESVAGELTFKTITSQFKYPALLKDATWFDKGFLLLAETYKYAFIQTMTYYSKFNPDPSKVDELLKIYQTILPPARLPLSKDDIELFKAFRKFASAKNIA